MIYVGIESADEEVKKDANRTSETNENQIEINKEKIGVNKGKIKEIDDALNEIYNMIDEPTAEEVQTSRQG